MSKDRKPDDIRKQVAQAEVMTAKAGFELQLKVSCEWLDAVTKIQTQHGKRLIIKGGGEF